jgi:hypothetical protein
MALTVYYEGLERTNTILILVFKQHSKQRILTKFIGSVFHTLEQEHFDILPNTV